MCGIAGIVDYAGAFGRERLGAIALAMRDTMVHRGPDDAGLWLDPAGTCALAHRRLSIIDLRPEGRQPMSGEGSDVQVTFNGEIYNYRALREELLRAGTRFHSATDTEVLPHLFRTLDPSALSRLDGMFAVGLWHAGRRKLLLARDPFGKKPLYYGQGPGWFAFASELQALMRVPGFDAEIDEEALAQYLLLQYVPSPWTICRGARKLDPGSYLELELGAGEAAVRTQRYARFEARERRAEPRAAFADRVAQLGAIAQRAVEKRLVSDVPLGAFLSGGVDSSLVVALATRELGRPLQTFSIGFAGTTETEHQFARQVAELLGTEHHEELVNPDGVALVHDIAARLDEPNGDSSCLPTLLLSHHARRFVTVALSGDGGDELFGGYSRYADTLNEVADWRSRLRRSLRERRWFAPADAYLSPRWLTCQPAQVEQLMGRLPARVVETLDHWRAGLNATSTPLMHRMRTLDVATYLPGAVLAKVDRMSMQVSLEVRCPLLDREVAGFAAGLSDSECWQAPADTKRLLKALLARYLPQPLIERKKMGFGLPANAWSRERMLELASDVLLGSGSRLGDLLDRQALRRWLDGQRKPGGFSIYQVWPMLIAELWLARTSEQQAAIAGSASRPRQALSVAP